MRASSVVFGLGFQYFIIPLSLLGLGLGGAYAYLVSEGRETVHACGGAAVYWVSLIATFLFAHAGGAQWAHAYALSRIGFFSCALLAYTCAGIVIALILRERSREISRLYFSDLTGAALGVVLSTLLLKVFGYEIAVLSLLIVGALPFALFSARTLSAAIVLRFCLIVCICLLVFGALGAQVTRLVSLACPERGPGLRTISNPYAQVNAFAIPLTKASRQELGTYSTSSVGTYTTTILFADCGIFVTPVLRFGSLEDVAFLRQSLRSIPLAYGTAGTASVGTVLIAGSGGGIDITRAQLFNADHIDAVEINPAMIELSKFFSDPRTSPYMQENVRTYQEDIRRFLATNETLYDVIIAARIGVYGSNALSDTPAFNLSVQGIQAYLEHVKPGGMLVLSGSVPSPVSTGLSEATVLEALARMGLDPSDKVLEIRGRERTEDLLVVRQEGFEGGAVHALRALAAARGFSSVRLLGKEDLERIMNPDSTITDDRPYVGSFTPQSGFTNKENLIRRFRYGFFLVALLCILAAGIPLLRRMGYSRRLSLSSHIASAGYFIAIGFGFVLFELLSMVQLSFPLANPSYAAAVTLGSLLVCGGIGSLLTTRIRDRWLAPYIVGTLAILLAFLFWEVAYGYQYLNSLIVEDFALRAALIFLILGVPGVVLGMFFPAGIRALERRSSARFIPWAWALDGIASIMGGFFAQALFRSYGLQIAFPIVAASYMLAAFFLIVLMRNDPAREFQENDALRVPPDSLRG